MPLPCSEECRCSQESREDKGPITIGIQFEARDVDQFEAAMERARLAIQRLGEETTRAAEAMERLSRAARTVREDTP